MNKTGKERIVKIKLVIAILAVGLLATQVCAGEQQVLKTDKDKVNYGIGVSVIRNFQQQGMEVDLELVYQGMKDALSGGKLLMSEGDLRKTMATYQTELRQKQARARQTALVENKKAGDAFLAQNKTKEGVVTLPSGLQYKILKAGDGKKPADADTVECRYRGTFIDGKEFDSTYGDSEPARFTVQDGGGIPGWREALKLMPVGSKWQIFLPASLAFGERGSGRGIEPNATLIFELELLAIK
jgi:FKBP-type peptidyl-prolyl cis-trans isomerase FklB